LAKIYLINNVDAGVPSQILGDRLFQCARAAAGTQTRHDKYSAETQLVDIVQDCLFGMRFKEFNDPELHSIVSNNDFSKHIENKHVNLFVEKTHELVSDKSAGRVAIELTSGVDSRLLLACCAASGVLPHCSFTIGNASDDDVLVAKSLSAALGIEHHRIDLDIDTTQIVEDARAFACGSEWLANASSYSWLPSVFRQLDNIRDSQVTGAGGEIAGDFYSTPLDSLYSCLPIAVWIRSRLEIPGSLARKLFKGNLIDLACNQAVKCFPSYMSNKSSFRTAQNIFYYEQRVQNWALPVLRASARWYRVIAPYMTKEYKQWAFTAHSHKYLKGRRAQIEVTRRLCPALAVVPYGTLEHRKYQTMYRKFVGRALVIARLRRLQADMLADRAVQVLLRDVALLQKIEMLCKSLQSNISYELVCKLLNNPRSDPRVLGVLITAALATHSELNSIQQFGDANA
jgi:hypothetical protein